MRAFCFSAVLFVTSLFTNLAGGQVTDVGITTVASDFVRTGRVFLLIFVTNSSSDPAVGVIVTNSFSSGAVIQSLFPSQGTTTASSNSFIWNVGPLSGHAVVSNNVLADFYVAGFVTNFASVTIANPDPNAANNSATTVVHVVSSVLSPRVTHGRISIGTLTASFGTEMGVAYEVQYSHSPGYIYRWFPSGCDFCAPLNDSSPLPVSEPWFTLTNIVGDGTLKSFSVPTSEADKRFYRLLLH